MTIDILATLLEAKTTLARTLEVEFDADNDRKIKWLLPQIDSSIEQIEKAEPVAWFVLNSDGPFNEGVILKPEDYHPTEWEHHAPEILQVAPLYLHPAAPTIPENIDEIALKIAASMKGYPVTNVVPEELDICEFARRLAARLLGEKK